MHVHKDALLSVLTELLSTPISVRFHLLISPRPLPALLALQRPVVHTHTLSSALWPGRSYTQSLHAIFTVPSLLSLLNFKSLKVVDLYSKLC